MKNEKTGTERGENWDHQALPVEKSGSLQNLESSSVNAADSDFSLLYKVVIVLSGN